jgi:S1-C subfamily serine protease
MKITFQLKFRLLFHVFAVALIGFFSTNGLAQSFGTGFFVSDYGHLVTNAHVVLGASKVSVRDSTGKTLDASVLKVDSDNDIALLKTEFLSVPLPLRSVVDIEKGAKVYTLGFPNPNLQGFESKYTEGVVSSYFGLRGQANSFQITTPLQPGNSGGPLLDASNTVVGIVFAKLDALKVLKSDGYLPENVNLAIKADYINPLLQVIPRHQRNPSKVKQPRSVADVEKSVVLVIAQGIKAPNESRPASFSDKSISPVRPSLGYGQQGRLVEEHVEGVIKTCVYRLEDGSMRVSRTSDLGRKCNPNDQFRF